MEIASSGAPAEFSARALTSAIKDVQGAQLTLNTLDRLNTSMTLTGPVLNPDYQFQKDVIGASYGLGTKLNITV